MANKNGRLIRVDDATYTTLKGRAAAESTSVAELVRRVARATTVLVVDPFLDHIEIVAPANGDADAMQEVVEWMKVEEVELLACAPEAVQNAIELNKARKALVIHTMPGGNTTEKLEAASRILQESVDRMKARKKAREN